jgi:hypothetical protein
VATTAKAGHHARLFFGIIPERRSAAAVGACDNSRSLRPTIGAQNANVDFGPQVFAAV